MIFNKSRSVGRLRKQKSNSCIITLLGDIGVGKTCIALQLCCSHFDSTYNPTIEEIFRHALVVDDQTYMLDILDTAGTREYKALRDEWIRRGDGYLLVYSITSRSSFEHIRTLFAQIQDVREGLITAALGKESVDRLRMRPIMLVGTKTDLESDRQISTQEGRDFARHLGCRFTEITAKNHDEVTELFSNTIRMVADFRLKLHPRISIPQMQASKASSKGSSDRGYRNRTGKYKKILLFLKALLRTTKAAPAPVDPKPGYG